MILRRLGLLLIAFAICRPIAFSQNNRNSPPSSVQGTLNLQVADPSGAALEATCIVSGSRNFSSVTVKTDAHGLCSVQDLPAGRYTVEVTRSGFDSRLLNFEIRKSSPVALRTALRVANLSTTVTVVSPMPITSDSLPADRTPILVQGLSAEDIDKSNALDLTDAMNKRLNGIYVNDNAGNPFEPDINYRGYTASPLLGTPQGLSVYLDGVRQNQPFGDVVNWDLIPKVAIDSMQLIPGSNPLFGLNTLGGAVSIRTKDGLSSQGASAQVIGGYFARRSVEAQYGGANNRGLDWFVAGNYFYEDGWRQLSPSDVKQSFAKLRWNHNNTSLALSGAYAINSLTGNGLQDFRALNRSYSSVYTVPDTIWNHSPSLTLAANHGFSKNLTFSGNAYYRHVRSNTTNGDINNDSFDQSLYNLNSSEIRALQAAGYSGFPTTGNSTTQPFPYWRCIAQALLKDEPSEKCTGLITNTQTQQNNYGLNGLFSWRSEHNQFSAGAGWDHGAITYGQLSQFGYLNADGITVTGVGAYADGSTDEDGDPVDTRVQLHGSVNTPSFFFMDTYHRDRWSVTASGRYNRTTIDNQDRLPSSDAHGSLTGNHVFQRFNPAIGGTYRITSSISAYANYSEANRAPTTIELGCSNPDFPCNLPNALVDDPPLEQVVSRTVEVGLRSVQQSPLSWSVGYFRGQNNNDLLFVASELTGFGYFMNFGKTKREGVELNLATRIKSVSLGGGYTFLNATYGSTQIVNGGSNSSNDTAQGGTPGVGGDITITPGDRIPQTPQHLLKIFADYKPLKKLEIDFNVIASSGSYARGNENNLHQPDGITYLGSGSSPAYGVANLGVHYTFSPKLQLFAQMNNITNNHYYTAAQLNTTPYDNNGRFIPRPFPAVGGDYPLRHTTFLAPGAPFTLYGGVRVTFRLK
jgi:outer membrane receptor protein involved in Fe transport